MRFHVQVNRLKVQDLPRSWSLPPQVEGRLTGQADLQVTVADGKVRTDGKGQGIIQEARVGGQPAEPIRLDLHAAGDGYRFAARQPPPRNNPSGPRLAVLPAVGGKSVRSAPGFLWHSPPWFQIIAHAGTMAIPPIPTTGPARPRQRPRDLEINLGMKDIDLEKFIKGLGFPLPFAVSGRLSFEVHAAIPVDTSRDFKTYRLNGSATLPWFVLEGLRLEGVEAKVVYANGILHLEHLRGRVPAVLQAVADAPPAGAFNGTAQVQLVPLGDLTAQADLKDIPLARVMSLVPGVAESSQGNLSGKATFQAPAGQLRNVETWQASGSLTTQQVRAYGLALTDATATFGLKGGTLSLSRVG
jgi:hypothetical protein